MTATPDHERTAEARLTDEQAHAIAQAAIALEHARQAVLQQQRKRREFFREHYEDIEIESVHGRDVVYPGAEWDTPENEAAHLASYAIEAELIKDKNRKRRAFRKALLTATRATAVGENGEL